MSLRDDLAAIVDKRRVLQPTGEWVVHMAGYWLADEILARYDLTPKEPA